MNLARNGWSLLHLMALLRTNIQSKDWIVLTTRKFYRKIAELPLLEWIRSGEETQIIRAISDRCSPWNQLTEINQIWNEAWKAVFLVIATLCSVAGSIGYCIYLLRDREVIHRVSWAILFVGALFSRRGHPPPVPQCGVSGRNFQPRGPLLLAWVFVVTYLLIQLRPAIADPRVVRVAFGSGVHVAFAFACRPILSPRSGVFSKRLGRSSRNHPLPG